jgi:hypothetical protein
MHATCPSQIIFLDFITLIFSGEDPHLAIFSILLLLPPSQVQIFSSAPFSNTLNRHSSLQVRDQISHPYKTGTITVV